jgi:hypothetical protein
MASPNINFVPGSQIHLLRGQSIQLVGQASESCIQFNSRNPKEYFTKPDNTLSCVITFSFDVTKALDLGIQIQEVSIMDSVLPDIKLTTLVTENSQSKIRLNNFIVYVEVTDTSLKPTDEKYKQKMKKEKDVINCKRWKTVLVKERPCLIKNYLILKIVNKP